MTDPELSAIRQRVLDELEESESAPVADDRPDPGSSNDDALGKSGDSVGDDRGPWWMTDPELCAIRQGVLDELERRENVPAEYDKPDPIVDDVLSGASWRELAAARDDLARARARYADAVHTARALGRSWGEIGRVLGVSKQQLHRRFRTQDGGR